MTTGALMSEEDPLLSHEKRAALLDHIISNPGIRFTDLMRNLSINESTLRYHLRVLVKGERIRSNMRKGMKRYYPFGYGYSKIKTGLMLERTNLDQNHEKVLRIIEGEPMINQKELSRRSGFGRFRIRRIVNKLMDMRLVRKRCQGKKVHYTKTSREELRKEVLRALISDLLRDNIDEETYLKAREKMESELF
jgi:predicted transcriptional regulator